MIGKFITLVWLKIKTTPKKTFGVIFFLVIAFYLSFPEIKTPNAKNNLATTIITEPEIPKIQKYFYANKDETGPDNIMAKAYLVGDLNTGEIIISKNQDQKSPMASVSKLMTAYVSTQIAPKDDTVTISKKALETQGTNGELKLGQKIKTTDILYPLLLESSNDAAEAIAEHFGRDIFISKMNQQAQNLQMLSTSYEDPSGLSPQNQSTVSDLFKLAGYVKQNKPELFQITTKRSISNKKQTWSNISQFLGDAGYLGGKSGFTNAARQTVISLFSLPLSEKGYRPVAITLLSTPDRHKDVENILKYLKKNIYYGGETDATTAWVKEKIGAPNIKDPDFVKLAFAGDIMLDRGVKNSVRKNFNNDYSALFSKLKILKDSDITFANLEGTASDRGEDLKNLYSFRMDGEVVPAIAGSGINILSVTNNHMGDWGRIAFIDTLARLKENEIAYTGGGNNQEEVEAPTIIEKYGMKIGYLGFSDKGPDGLQAGADIAGILSTKNPRFEEIIKNASKQVDYLVIYFHFGEEYKTDHNKRQETLAHLAVDNGAKIVIGSHPHVVQDFETYKNSYIAYSLGNFIFDQKFSAKTMEGMLLQVKLKKDGTMSVNKNIVKLNSAFQPDKVVLGKEEKVKFK